ncbi:MAG: phosphate-starvation-inducible PsiE family protein [bacterium]|nr:MAG: phosphate-starvation-inducible PsiE family protein [bacterium]
MLSAEKIKAHYGFTPGDEEILAKLRPLMKEHRDGLGQTLMEYVMGHSDMAEFFPSPDKQKHHSMVFAGWFMRLFSGTYDEAYFRNLRQVGKVHVDIKLDGHFVNSAMGEVRRVVLGVIEDHVPAEERKAALLAVNKILDINLDVLTSSYRQEELNKYFLSYRVENKLIGGLERFTHGLNLVLALALGFVSLAVVGLFFFDVSKIFTLDHPENGIIAAFGSMLIIWMMIELLDTEVSHLKGKKIPIKIFVGVVIVAFLRKVLIASLAHEDIFGIASKVGTLMVLGIVYWLVTKSDRA